MVVRYGVAREGRITDVAELLNFGPALATDITITLAFVDGKGASSEERTLAFPALAPGDSVTMMPGLMLPREKKHMAPTGRELADTGLRLRASWSWRDDRRRWFLPMKPSGHSSKVVIDLRAYADSVSEGLIVQDSTIESVLQEMREDRRRERFEDHARRSSADMSGLPPEVRVRIDAARVRSQFELWIARIRHAIRWGRSKIPLPRSARPPR